MSDTAPAIPKGWKTKTTFDDATDSGPPVPDGFVPIKTPGEAFSKQVMEPLSAGGIGGFDRDQDSAIFSESDLLRIGMAKDNKTKIRRASARSGIPIDHFGERNGEIIYWDSTARKYVPLIPNVSGDGARGVISRSAQNIAAGAAGALGTVVGGVTGLVMGPTGASVPASAGVTGAIDMFVSYLDQAMAGEDVKWMDNGLSALKNAGYTALGQLSGNALAKIFNRNPMNVAVYDRIKAIDPKRMDAAKEVTKIAKDEFGIDLTAAQATELPSLLGNQRVAARWGETMDDLAALRDKQWYTDVPEAVTGQINKMSASRGGRGVGEFTGAAKDISQAAVDQRQIAARKFFGKALDNREPFNNAALDEQMTRPIMGKAWAAAKVRAQNRGRTLPEYFEVDDAGNIVRTIKKPDWRAWHDIKMSLDDIVRDNKTTVGKNSSIADDAALNKAQMMRELLPQNPDYAQALRKYGESSRQIDLILRGPIGVLRKYSGDDVVGIVKQVFSEQKFNPITITKMRQRFVAAGKENEWNAGVAVWLDDFLDSAQRYTVEGRRNTPGFFHQSLANRRAQLYAIVGPKHALGWDRLLHVLEKARKGLPEGSPTATDLGVNAPDVKSSVVSRIGKFTSANSYVNPGDTIADAVVKMRQPEARRRFVKHLLSTGGLAELQKLRLLKPNEERALKLVGDMAFRAGITGAAAGLGLDGGPTRRAEEERRQNQ
jgi:hypothetical protein